MYLVLKFWIRFQPYGFESKSVDITLTTHGKRVYHVYVSIESIMRGNRKPRNIYLTLDNDENLSLLGKLIVKKMEANGVKILRGERVGPHAKYYAYLHSNWVEGEPFVVVDDDVLYSKGMLTKLVDAHITNPGSNICIRAFRIAMTEAGVDSYKNWSACTEKETSHKIFATNVGGVLVCPEFAEILRGMNDKFKQVCPKADDIWFHWISLRYRLPYFCCVDEFMNPPVIPFSQGDALHVTNNSGGNDKQIFATYSTADIDDLRRLP
jgi:hypothetical protein